MRQRGLKKRPRPVLQKLMRTGGPHCPVACFETLFQSVLQNCKNVVLSTFLPYTEGKRLVSNKSVVCTTASWSECAQPVHEEHGKRRRTWYYCKELYQPFSAKDNRKKAEESRSKQQRAITGHKNKQSMMTWRIIYILVRSWVEEVICSNAQNSPANCSIFITSSCIKLFPITTHGISNL